MQVSIHTPAQRLFHGDAVRLNAVASNGAFGILPNHIDFVTALVPSILLLTLDDETERVFGIDEGLLIKQAHHTRIAVRRAVQGKDLQALTKLVSETFGRVKDEERRARTALSRLEAGVVRHLIQLRTAQ